MPSSGKRTLSGWVITGMGSRRARELTRRLVEAPLGGLRPTSHVAYFQRDEYSRRLLACDVDGNHAHRARGGLMELVQEVAALFDRDLTRLEQELRAFTATHALWVVAPGVSNAAAPLALHLEGTLREYIGRQLGHREYTRDRAREFSARAIPQQEILERVGELRGTIPPA